MKKNNKKVNLDDYYLGIITASDEFLKGNNRSTENYYDPFEKISDDRAHEVGCVVLLKKNAISYTDKENSASSDGLKYKLGHYNKEGIALRYVVPFRNCYKQEPKVYNEDDFYNNMPLYNEVFNREYYINRSSDGTESLEIVNFFIKNEAVNSYRRSISNGTVEVSEPLSYEKPSNNKVVQFIRK